MKKTITLLSLLTLFALQVLAQDGDYSFTNTDSEIKFRISHMGPFKVKGQFSDFKGKLSFDGGTLMEARANIRVESIDTRNKKRDENLRKEAYLNPGSFPEIRFTADRLTQDDSGYLLYGNLRIQQTEKAISMPVDIDYDPDTDSLVLEAETEISRKAFNLVFESMNGLIGDKVDIEVRIKASKL